MYAPRVLKVAIHRTMRADFFKNERRPVTRTPLIGFLDVIKDFILKRYASFKFIWAVLSQKGENW